MVIALYFILLPARTVTHLAEIYSAYYSTNRFSLTVLLHKQFYKNSFTGKHFITLFLIVIKEVGWIVWRVKFIHISKPRHMSPISRVLYNHTRFYSCMQWYTLECQMTIKSCKFSSAYPVKLTFVTFLPGEWYGIPSQSKTGRHKLFAYILLLNFTCFWLFYFY